MKFIPLATAAALASTQWAAAQTFSVPMNPDLPSEITAAAKSAESEGNYAAAIRQYKRLLEVFPNDPTLQAPVYLAMSVDEGKAGDADKQQLFASISRQLDPGLEKRAEADAGNASLTRGSGNKADTVLAIAQLALNGYLAARATRQQSAAAPPPAQQNGYQYPAAPYGQAGYQPPPNNQYAAQPGYYDPNQNGGAPQQAAAGQYPPQNGQYQPNQPQAQYPQGAQPGQYQAQQSGYPQQPQYQQQQPGYPQQPSQQPYTQQGAPGQYQAQQPGYPQQPQYQQQQSGYPQQPGQQPYPQQGAPGQYPPQQAGYYPAPPPQAPYGVPANGYVPGQQTRGQESAPIKVAYDSSRSGDSAYFAKGCGALLTVNSGSLVFTPACGLAPRVIPAGDIWEVRMNSTVGKQIGAFHIITKKGLYLDLAPSSGDRDQAQTDVDTLRKSLSLAE